MFLFCSIMRMLRIRDYPYVLVRFACRDCPRIGRYRLAVGSQRMPVLFTLLATRAD